MNLSLYTYTSPFHVVDNATNREDYIFEYMNEDEKEYEIRFYNSVLKFAVAEGLIKSDAGFGFIDPSDKTHSWQWAVCTTNFRSLSDPTELDTFLVRITNGEEHGRNKLADLSFRLGTLYDHKLINTIITRMMKSLLVIPYKLTPQEEEDIWMQLHAEHPYIWLAIYLQVVMFSEIGKLGKP